VLKNWYDERSMARLMYVCDGIMLIESERIGDRFVYKFSIPKMIAGMNLSEFIRFRTQRGTLEIDTSRDIA
jgi:hypothetical protein